MGKSQQGVLGFTKRFGQSNLAADLAAIVAINTRRTQNQPRTNLRTQTKPHAADLAAQTDKKIMRVPVHNICDRGRQCPRLRFIEQS